MIDATFLHLPGVGRVTEGRFWQAGFDSWDAMWNALRAGKPPRELLRRIQQKELFPLHEGEPSDAKALAWIDCLDQSRLALRDKQYQYFLDLLRPADHWRLLGSVLHEALYLDIETTGLSSELHYVTVVGALYGAEFYQWVWPEPLEELAELIRSAPLIVTFNGRRFDVPFLQEKTPAVPPPRAHVDLLYIARGAGFKGTQKQVEEALGLFRDEDLRGLDGAEAVASWCSALYGDRSSYQQLLRYNRADVEMMPAIAAELCQILNRHTQNMPDREPAQPPSSGRLCRKPRSFAALQRTWRERRPGLHLLEPNLLARFGRAPVVVGIDLRAKPANPTGWVLCEGSRIKTRVVHDDDDILGLTLAASPDLVSIDAPLSLPRGRSSVSDESPCRETGGIVRDAERILWARGIRVYPALIKQMQGLTHRGIELTRKLEAHGIRVIESYPGAAQDILNIPRKKLDEGLLRQGLAQFGYQLRGAMTHDELDAVTSALVGQFYLADQFEAIGADDEGYMIIPKWSGMSWGAEGGGRRRTVSMVGLPGSGKTTLTRALAQRLGWRSFVLGDVLRECARQDTGLRESLARGELAPEPLVHDLILQAVQEREEPGLLVDGFPRHREQIGLAEELFTGWTVMFLDTDRAIAVKRLTQRFSCGYCGLTTNCGTQAEEPCPSCGCFEWQFREEDSIATVRQRVHDSDRRLRDMLANLRDVHVVRIDACSPMQTVVDSAISEILATRLG